MRATILLILCVLLGACSVKQQRPEIFSDVAIVNSTVSLQFPIGTNKAEQELLIEAAKMHTDAFIEDLGPIDPIDVYLFRGESVPTTHTGVILGVYHIPNGPIYAIMGRKYHIPALYHELAHHMIVHDTEHKDSRWPTWNFAEQQVNDLLLKQRRFLNKWVIMNADK